MGRLEAYGRFYSFLAKVIAEEPDKRVSVRRYPFEDTQGRITTTVKVGGNTEHWYWVQGQWTRVT